jgi:hypothetical protein
LRCERAEYCQWDYLSVGYVAQPFGVALLVAVKNEKKKSGQSAAQFRMGELVGAGTDA